MWQWLAHPAQAHSVRAKPNSVRGGAAVVGVTAAVSLPLSWRPVLVVLFMAALPAASFSPEDGRGPALGVPRETALCAVSVVVSRRLGFGLG